MGNISTDEKYLLWIMKERHNSNSRFKPYFELLPEKFKTGLSFSEDALAALKGSQLDCVLVADIEFLKERFLALLESLRNIFQPELLTWDQYLWACELWSTNSMTVHLPVGNLSACLIPVAGFFNHSVELYFCETKDLVPFSPRNELEALSSVFSSINSLIPTSGSNLEEISALQMLLYETVSKVESLGDDHPDSMIRSDLADDTAENLLIWAKDEGMRTKLEISCFQKAGRGAVASKIQWLKKGEEDRSTLLFSVETQVAFFINLLL